MPNQPFEPPNEQAMVTLRVYGDLGSLASIGWLLLSVNQAYNALYVLDAYDAFPPRFLVDYQGTIVQSLPRRQPLGHLVPVERRARLVRATFASPGSWDVAGLGRIAESIRKYIKDEHGRKRGREWQDAAERQRVDLELEERRVDILTKKVQLMRDAGLEEHLIRAYILGPVTDPLNALDSAKRRGLITGADIVQEGDDSEPRT